MSEQEVQVKFGATTGDAEAGVANFLSKMQNFFSELEEGKAHLKEFAELAAAAFAIEKIDQFVERIGDLGLQVERTATQLGLATTQVSLLNYASETNDVSTQQMRGQLERLTSGLEEAEKGGNKQAAALALMGINAKEFIAQGGTTADLIDKMATKTAELAPTMNMAGIYIALMGRSGADSIPVFKELGNNIDEVKQKVDAAGRTFDPEFTERIATTRKANIDLKEATSGLGAAMFSDLKPAIDGGILVLRDFTQDLIDSATKGGLLQEGLVLLSGAFLSIETVILEINSFLQQFIEGITTLVADATARITSFVSAANSLLHGHAAEAKATIEATSAAIAADDAARNQASITRDEQLSAKLKTIWADYYKTLNDLSKGAPATQPKGTFSAGGGATPVPSLATGDSYAEQAKKELEAYLAKIDVEEQLDKGHYDLVLALEDQKLARLKAFYGQDSKEYQDALRKKIQITQQAEKEEMQGWTEFYRKMDSTYNSFIQNIFSGTMTFTQIWRKAISGVVVDFLQSIPKMIRGWEIGEQLKTQATLAGNAARSASDQLAAKASMGARFEGMIKEIMADAARTYSGVFGFLSPVMGPFAAIPAAAAAALVGGMSALIPSYDVGTPYVPETGLAMIHRGERIITAADNAAGGGGAGGKVTMNVYAMDSQDVVRFFKQNADAVMNGLKLSARNGHRGVHLT